MVHFSGHAEFEGIYLEDSTGHHKLVATEALEKLFEQLSEHVECVILNACYSYEQAKAISNYIPYTIGMSDSILDSASIAFTLGFYKALGAGEDYSSSYKFGVVNIKLEGIRGDDLPILITTDK